MSRRNNKEIPFVMSRQSGYLHDQSLPMSAKCVQLVETTKSVYNGGRGGGGGGWDPPILCLHNKIFNLSRPPAPMVLN